MPQWSVITKSPLHHYGKEKEEQYFIQINKLKFYISILGVSSPYFKNFMEFPQPKVA